MCRRGNGLAEREVIPETHTKLGPSHDTPIGVWEFIPSFFFVGGFPLSVYLDAYFRSRCSRFHVHSGDVRIRIVCVYCRALLDV